MEQIVGLCVYFSLTDWTINTPPTPADLSFHKQEKYKYNTNANRNVISWKHKYKYMINHNWSLGSQLLGQYDLDPILTGTLTENLRGKRTNKILYLMCVTVSWHMNIIECMLKTKFALFWGLKANWWMIETLFWKLLFRGNHQCAMNDKIFNFVGNKPLPNAFTAAS